MTNKLPEELKIAQTTDSALTSPTVISEPTFDLSKIAAGVRLILEGLGEDLSRAGIRETPQRVAQMYQEICGGLLESPQTALKVIPDENYEELILVRDIPIYSLCEHHLIPFFGQVHIAYLPSQGRIVGLSKLAQVANSLARRPQLQERLTSQIADLLAQVLSPQAVLVLMQCEHLCMSMRGGRVLGSKVVTTAVRGIWITAHQQRAEVMESLHHKL
jgi:GTP cyclohydrolase IA